MHTLDRGIVGGREKERGGGGGEWVAEIAKYPTLFSLSRPVSLLSLRSLSPGSWVAEIADPLRPGRSGARGGRAFRGPGSRGVRL